MNWRTGARIIFATVGLGVAATVFVLSRNQPPPPAPPPDAPRLDPNVNLVSGPGVLTIDRGSQPPVEVTYTGSRSYDDGRMRFEGAVVKGLGERSYTLRAAALETRGPVDKGKLPAQLDVTGRFTFEGSDGMVVEAEQGTYDDTAGVLTIPGAVTFRRGRLSGESTGAVYNRDQDTVTFLESSKAHVAADAKGVGAAEVTSKRMLLTHGQHTLRLEEDARIAGEVQVLTSRTATIGFTDDESAVKHLELRGSANVTPAGKTVDGQPTMSADDITMSLHPDGVTMQHATLTGNALMSTTGAGRTRSIRASWIDLFTGKDGRTLTALTARDQVRVEIPATATSAGRTITSSTLQAKGDEKRGLTQARFEGNPRFEEVPQAGAKPRVGAATTLVLTLDGQLDAIQKAEFQQNATFDDGRAKAWADIATYDDARQMLLLTPNAREPRKLSHVETPDITVDGRDIDLNLQNEDLHARREVVTQTTGKADGKKAAPTSLFESGKPVFGTASELRYTRESGKAIYTGTAQTPAWLKQDNTAVGATRIEFTESTYRLDASGQVDSTIHMAVPATDGKPKTPERYKVLAETLAYDDTRRVAVYKGPKVALTMADGGTIESSALTFELAKESRTLNRMRAEGRNSGVSGTLPDGYEFLGDDLVYRADTDTYRLMGSPAVIKSRSKPAPGAASSSECQFMVSTVLELNRRTGSIDSPGSGPAPRSTETRSCATPIRSIK